MEENQKIKVNKFDVTYWANERERALTHKWYAIGRIDLLIISISGGSIFFIFELIKYVKEQNSCPDYTLAKIAGLSFMLAIILNFVSQIFGMKANKSDAKYCKGMMEIERKKTVSEMEIGGHRSLASSYSKAVNACNIMSYITMAIGAILIMIFASTKV